MGSCTCIKNRESEESDIILSSNPAYFNREQLEEATMVQRTSLDIQVPNNESLHTSGESVISPSLHVLFSDPVRKTVQINEVPKISQRIPFTDLNQLPPKRSSVIYPAFPHQRKTSDESVVQCIVVSTHRNEYQYAPSFSKEDSGDEITEIVSEISELTPSLIFRDYTKKNKYPRIKTRNSSPEIFERKPLLKIRARSHSPHRGRSSKPNLAAFSNWTISESSWRLQGNAGNSDLGTKDSGVQNSLYDSGSESEFQWDDDCVWATFVPVTPMVGCETSMSKTERTSMRRSQLSLLETIKNSRMEELKTKEKSNFTISRREWETTGVGL